MSDKPCERNSTRHNQKISEFDANRLMAKPETPPNYMPKVDEPPMGYFEDFLEFVSATWRPVLFGFFCAIALILWLALG